ncbi:MAG TPA: 16S rRNA (adenine(1518)-N(6)/adenine(1519)-N(6))-dimethyltransferase RsmA [Candidatus Avacidaminococcus intestinavium]|uniref:Ribosomal RNA small subunit methyltransferase A n=1 Tax=Candidatus Avacidaminococcus intestinavium TaxID=2840684 RepID=A0A9D1MR23_9FIRM|nr:16S rRNA (adenine(1518)-N(6)/adenine(1519)-N(6))-dimethyltransferase RsmA [Candidatus Avacidaminococcus intestinavium]
MEQPIIARKNVTNHILKSFNIRADKRLGQNFLTDEQIVAQIVEAATLQQDDCVLEIGPGIGTLTQALAEKGAAVTAVELDKRLLPVLKETLAAYPNVNIINADILQLDIKEAVNNQSFKVVANLPYYITTPIVFHLLEQKLPMERLVVMVQKEVAERMVAKPGGKDYGALSVAVQYYAEPKIAFKVPPTSFIPAPNVESAVIVCEVRKQPPVTLTDEKIFFRVVKAAFSVRRKMLNNALKNMGITAEEVKTWLEAAGIDGKRRGETLSLTEFAKLANVYVTLKVVS